MVEKKHSDTVKKQRGNIATLKPFKKGKGVDIDPRINTKGRPKSFDQLRALFQGIGEQPIVINGKTYTRAEAIGLAMSADKKLMRDFLEYAYGKVPQAVDVTTKGEKIQNAEITDRAITTLADALRERISGES